MKYFLFPISTILSTNMNASLNRNPTNKLHPTTNDTLYNLIHQYDLKAAIDRCKSHPEECSYVFKSEKGEEVRNRMSV